MTRISKEPNSEVKVYFDPQIFLLQSQGGISKYFSEIIREMLSNPSLGIRPVFYSLPMRFNRHSSSVFGLRFLNLPRFVRALLFLVFSVLPAKRAALVHQTYYSKLFVKSSAPWITTLYDMIPETHGKPHAKNPHLDKLELLTMATNVISISRHSENTLRRLIPDFAGLVDVVPLAGSYSPKATSSGHRCNQTFLFVGNRAGYKNGDLVIEAMCLMSSHDHKLVFVGHPFSEAELRRIRESGLGDNVSNTEASDSELMELYASSCALIFPSEIEGFGLPVLEAMSLGVPVVAFDNPINREISQSAPYYFEDLTSASLSQAIELVCHDSELRKEKVRLGLKIASEYSWGRTSELTAAVYKRVIASKATELNEVA